MAIELPPRGIDALDERLASLEDPAFAAHLVDENPSLFIRTLAQRDREARARTRTSWSAALAGTAIVSITVGLFISPMVMKFFTPAQTPRHTVATAPPRPSAARRHVQPKHRALVIPPRLAAQAEIRHIEARAATAKPVPKPAFKPQIQPAAAADQAASTQASTGAVVATTPATSSTTTTSPAYYPDPPPPTWSKSGPPNGTGAQHWGSAGPVVLVGRDPCTPPGGRIGNVLQHF
ncbi:MAG TPA: hypothetical protein VN905_09475 [Candidatus Binatia bacterium]|nr:hypothetical protein [Candidatus Binatia bacterium]